MQDRVGGGFGLACVSDIAIADHQAQFGLPETSLGLLPAQIAPFVVKRIGLTQARRLALTARTLTSPMRWRIRHWRNSPAGYSGWVASFIGNAIKFTPRQGNIGISAMSNGEEIVFSVRDSGEGIAPEQLPHVFDRYWTQTENNPTGSGLGLYITQGIIQAHGGKIVAESEVGRGSEFRFTVPKVTGNAHT